MYTFFKTNISQNKITIYLKVTTRLINLSGKFKVNQFPMDSFTGVVLVVCAVPLNRGTLPARSAVLANTVAP